MNNIDEAAEKYADDIRLHDYHFEETASLKEQVQDDFKAGAEWAIAQFKAEQKQSAGDIVKELAEWSLRYPRNVTYSSSCQPQMDGKLIALEERAKKWLDETTQKQLSNEENNKALP